jgi:NADH-quinone oxidoreductase subunit J
MDKAFFILALVTTLGALGAAFYRNVMHCALSLILFFFGIAGEFFLLRAEFVGAVQVLVYAGAVGVLVLFAVMLTRHFDATQPFELFAGGRIGWFTGFLTSVIVAGVLVWAILRDTLLSKTIAKPPTVKAAQLGIDMMKDYVIPFEVVGILLTAAMIGAIVLALEEVRTRR